MRNPLHYQLSVLVVLCFAACTVSRICNIGYGQRGLRFQNEIIWQRDCKETTYCFEAVTSDIEKVKPLIDYPWDPYYRQFYIKSCGGFLGMANDYHPWIDIEGASEKVLGSVKVNLTFAPTITTVGGTENFDLRYTCRKDLCSGASAAASYAGLTALLGIVVASGLLSLL